MNITRSTPSIILCCHFFHELGRKFASFHPLLSPLPQTFCTVLSMPMHFFPNHGQKLTSFPFYHQVCVYWRYQRLRVPQWVGWAAVWWAMQSGLWGAGILCTSRHWEHCDRVYLPLELYWTWMWGDQENDSHVSGLVFRKPLLLWFSFLTHNNESMGLEPSSWAVYYGCVDWDWSGTFSFKSHRETSKTTETNL